MALSLETVSVVQLLLLLELVTKGYCATVDDVVKLHNDLFRSYRREIPPVYQQDKAVKVRVSLFLLMIHDLDMKNQVLTTSGWLNLNWEDEFLHWNSSEYGGVEEITVSQSSVWLPDLLVENTAQNFGSIGSDSILVSIRSTGHISWEPGILTKTICEVNIGKYPFDYQKCEIKFLTWMHTNKTLDVQSDVGKIISVAKLVVRRSCVPEAKGSQTSLRVLLWRSLKIGLRAPEFSALSDDLKRWCAVLLTHTGVKFVIELLRKRTFYVLNTIIPVMMLSLLNVLVFLLPASSGEKMALAVTVLLSFTVYLSIISEVMPRTSESVSILAVYLTTLLSLSTMSVLSSGVVMNMIHEKTNKPVPHFLKGLVCCRLREIRQQLRQGTFQERVQSFRKPGRHHKHSFSVHHNEAYSENGISDCDFSRRKHPGNENNCAHVFQSHNHVRESCRSCTIMEPMLSDTHVGDDFFRSENSVNFARKPKAETEGEEWALITWMDVGSAVDTVLFWLFLGFTLTSTMTVFILFSLP